MLFPWDYLFSLLLSFRFQKLLLGTRMPRIRVSPLGPNKFDSFDTRVSETIELFLLPKILAGQGFSAFSILGLVSLWSVGTELNTAKQVLLRHKTNHAETLPTRKVSAWLSKFHCAEKSFSVRGKVSLWFSLRFYSSVGIDPSTVISSSPSASSITETL